jgi:mannose-1-phosphate guanylyltransferase
MSLKAMALTAGQGTRLRPLTLNIAKPAVPFLGRPLLCHAARHLDCLKIEKLVMNLHWCGETVKTASQYLSPDLKLAYSNEEATLLGSGGAIKNAEPLLEGADTILIFNGDEVFLPENPEILKEAYDFHLRSKNLATLLVMDHPGVGKEFGGAWVDSENNIKKFSKTSVPSLKGFHYVGFMFLQMSAMKYFSAPAKDENLLYDCLNRAMEVGEKVRVHPCKAQWFETGDITSFLKATKTISDQTKNPHRSSEISDLVEFLDSTVHLGSCIYLEKDLQPFDQPGRCQLSVRIAIEDFVGGEFSIRPQGQFALSDLVWFRSDNSMPQRKDELWKSTCAEIFIGEKGSTNYTEFNFSSTLDWNAYSFDSERTGMRPAEVRCHVHQNFNSIGSDPVATIGFQFDLDTIPFEIGVTAVIDWKDGLKEYYSLQHTKDKPDFHNRKDWTWRLG